MGDLRTEGIYACRGLKAVGSSGGLGVWPFTSPPTQIQYAVFLRFEPDGTALRMQRDEPMMAQEAADWLSVHRRDAWRVGRYTLVDHRLQIVFPNSVGGPTIFQGTVYALGLALEQRSDYFTAYREFVFEAF